MNKINLPKKGLTEVINVLLSVNGTEDSKETSTLKRFDDRFYVCNIAMMNTLTSPTYKVHFTTKEDEVSLEIFDKWSTIARIKYVCNPYPIADSIHLVHDFNAMIDRVYITCTGRSTGNETLVHAKGNIDVSSMTEEKHFQLSTVYELPFTAPEFDFIQNNPMICDSNIIDIFFCTEYTNLNNILLDVVKEVKARYKSILKE